MPDCRVECAYIFAVNLAFAFFPKKQKKCSDASLLFNKILFKHSDGRIELSEVRIVKIKLIDQR